MRRSPSKRSRLSLVAAYGPPLCLAIVALVQINMAGRGNAAPSKGGGFGLFSTVDIPGNRKVRVWLRKNDRSEIFAAQHFAESHNRSLRWLKALPSKSRMDSLAREVAKFTRGQGIDSVGIEVVKVVFDGENGKVWRKSVGGYLLELNEDGYPKAR